MKRKLNPVFYLLLIMALAAFVSRAPAEEAYDVLIRGGKVVDGTGSAWFYGDVAVKDGRIAAVGRLSDTSARQVIDATGLAVSPGFIDMHTHSEYTLLADGRGLSKVRQGVTVEIVGEGSSPGPRRPGMGGGRGGGEIEPDWTTLRGYFDAIQRSGISINVASYVGTGQLRRYVIGEEHRKPTAEELEQMKTLLAEAMEDGALGLCAALETPGQSQPSDAVSDTAEIIELAKVVARYGGIYSTHLRNQSEGLFESIAEAAEIGEKAGLPVEIFHLKAAGRPQFGKMKDVLKAIGDARSRGIDIAADIYPYIAAAHGLSTEVPRWAHEGGTDKFLERLGNPELRPRIKKEMTDYMTTKYFNELEGKGGFDAVVVSSVRKNPERYEGKTIGEIAREQGKPPADMVLDLLIEQDAAVGVVMFYMSEEDVTLGLQSPLTSIDSDGSAISPDRGGKPHPRYYGTFPRILGHYVRDRKALGLEEAVRKMTSYAAQRLGLEDRGQIRKGMWADIVIFSPERIIDRATFVDPHQFPEGIDYVLVNGVVVVERGQHTGEFPGRVLYGPGRKEPTSTSSRM